ncbi:MAG TPA: hypothetical protein VIZ58_12880, partial [Thermoanaerobaculia bacterium]
PVGKALYCPAAVSRAPGDVLLLARAAEGDLVVAEWKEGGWSEPRRSDVLSAVPADWPLAACARGGGIDAFARTPDGELLHLRGDGPAFSRVELLGAPAAASPFGAVVPLGLAGTPAACSALPERVDVFAAGETGELLHTWNQDGEWSGFESLGVPEVRESRSVPMAGGLAACSCGPARTALFARGTGGDLLMNFWDGARWSGFESLGWPQVQDQTYPAVRCAAPLTGPPAACSWGAGRMDVFARGPHGDVLHKSWDGREWGPFVSWGMPGAEDRKRLASTGAISACTWGPGRLDVFTRAVDGALYHRVGDGSAVP